MNFFNPEKITKKRGEIQLRKKYDFFSPEIFYFERKKFRKTNIEITF